MQLCMLRKLFALSYLQPIKIWDISNFLVDPQKCVILIYQKVSFIYSATLVPAGQLCQLVNCMLPFIHIDISFTKQKESNVIMQTNNLKTFQPNTISCHEVSSLLTIAIQAPYIEPLN